MEEVTLHEISILESESIQKISSVFWVADRHLVWSGVIFLRCMYVLTRDLRSSGVSTNKEIKLFS